MLRRLTAVLFACAASLVACDSQAQSAGTPTLYRLSLPGTNWALDTTLSITNDPNQSAAVNSFYKPLDELREDGEFRLSAFQIRPGRFQVGVITIKLRPGTPQSTAADLRAFALEELRKTQSIRGNGKTYHNQIPVAQYTVWRHFDDGNQYVGSIPRAESGLSCPEAYFVKDDVSAITTLCTSQFDESEERLFYSLIDNLKFVDTSAPSGSFDYYQKGRIAYFHKEYQHAVELLAAGLKLDDERQELTRNNWRELVMDLADAYRRTEDREATIKTLTYGIGKDPENTTLLMGLARFYALIGDEDKPCQF